MSIPIIDNIYTEDTEYNDTITLTTVDANYSVCENYDEATVIISDDDCK